MASKIIPATHSLLGAPIFGTLNKRDITVSEGTKFYASSEMSGGSWTEYQKIDIKTRQHLPVIFGTFASGFRPIENMIEPGQAVIETGYFCGKPSSPRIVLHPETFAEYFPADTCTVHAECRNNPKLAKACFADNGGKLPERMINILSAHRGQGDYRKSALSRVAATAEEIASLIRDGYLKKIGKGFSLTAEGKNQLPDNYY